MLSCGSEDLVKFRMLLVMVLSACASAQPRDLGFQWLEPSPRLDFRFQSCDHEAVLEEAARLHDRRARGTGEAILPRLGSDLCAVIAHLGNPHRVEMHHPDLSAELVYGYFEESPVANLRPTLRAMLKPLDAPDGPWALSSIEWLER